MVELIQDNVSCLKQGIDLLGGLSAEEYSRPVPACFNSTIGGHIRHNIDHYYSFAKGHAEGRIDYDCRLRDSRVETDPKVACTQMQELSNALSEIPAGMLDREVQVVMDSGSDAAQGCASRSTLQRELQFLLSHTVHHYALIAVICQLRGIESAKGFGVAPSTLRYRNASSCAQ